MAFTAAILTIAMKVCICYACRDNLKLVFVLFSYRCFHQMIGLLPAEASLLLLEAAVVARSEQ